MKISPAQGIVVNNISIKDFWGVLQIRGIFEGLAARLATTVITKEEIRKLESFNKNMKKFISNNDILSFGKESDKFHELILGICGNNRLIQL